MAKRKYNKRSSYWDKFEKPNSPNQITYASHNNYEPELAGEPYYTASASYSQEAFASYSRTSSPNSLNRINRSAVAPTADRFSSIRSGILPYDYGERGVNVRDAIELCQKAYANISIFRNAVDIMSEFANTEIFLKGGTQKSRNFFNEWFKKINLTNLKDQYFREYYRSGNIFLYRIDGKFEAGDFAKLVSLIAPEGESQNIIPLKYVLLNPYDIVAHNGVAFNQGAYDKILSSYELSRLRDPQTEEEKKIIDSLPKDVREKIQKGSYDQKGVLLKLEADKLLYSFYKKQDYEPFAIPFGYPVLEDINAKLELKKMDQAITRTVENVILLITMGAEPEKGGINNANIQAMQQLFRNESVGRVLVADYTTKAEFIIPDLSKVLGYEKYKVLNEDIKQGLQNIVVGEEKYSSTQIKAQIFIDRLKEARNSFISDFLQKEIKRIAQNLGFRSYPQAMFKDIDMRDETQLMRVATRLMELGILTPQQGMEMFHNGKFPDADEIEPAQQAFVEQREKGYYNPIVGGIPTIEAAGSKEKTPKANSTPQSSGRPEGTTEIPLEQSKAESFSQKAIQTVIGCIETLRESIKSEMKTKLKISRFNKKHESMLDKLCEAVACSSNMENWSQTAVSCVNDLEQIQNLGIKNEILEIAAKYELENYPASILYHSKNCE